jgi:hypothetical protein
VIERPGRQDCRWWSIDISRPTKKPYFPRS